MAKTLITKGLFFSALLLLIFILLQLASFQGLELDIKWISVSFLPLLLALIFSGIIRTANAFGVEVELGLDTPVGALELTAKDAAYFQRSADKQDITYLRSLSALNRSETQRLAFVEGKKKYYDVWAIKEYIESFPNLVFIEITNKNRKFLYLLPIDIFKDCRQVIDTQIERLKIALENGTIEEQFASEVEDRRVFTTENILDTLTQIRRSRHRYIPVIDEAGFLVGVATKERIEEKIAEGVLASVSVNAAGKGK